MRHEAERETLLSEQKLGLLVRIFRCKASLYTALASLEQRNNERALTTQVLAFLEQRKNELCLTRMALTQSTGSKAVTRLHSTCVSGLNSEMYTFHSFTTPLWYVQVDRKVEMT